MDRHRAGGSVPPSGGQASQAEAPGLSRRVADVLLGRGMTLGLAVGALLLGITTFSVLSGGSPFGPTKPGVFVGIVLVNLAVLLLLVASLAGRLVRVWAERRRGSAGSRLHVRLVLLFGVVAVVPSMLVAAFSALFFNLGIQAWFSDRVRGTLEACLQASRGLSGGAPRRPFAAMRWPWLPISIACPRAAARQRPRLRPACWPPIRRCAT